MQATTEIGLLTTASPVPQYLPNKGLEAAFIAVHSLILLASLIGNTLAMIALVSRKSSIYPWFLNLITSDLIKTVLCMPYSLYLLSTPKYRTGDKVSDPLLCNPLMGYIFTVSLFVSLLSNTCIAIDRIVATYFPFQYSTTIMRWSWKRIVAITWVTVALFSLLPLVIDWKIKRTAYTILRFMPMCVLEVFELEIITRETDESKASLILALTSTYYFIMFGLPVIIVCVSTAIVTYKLNEPNFKGELKFNKARKCQVTMSKDKRVSDSTISNRFAVTELSGASGEAYRTSLASSRESDVTLCGEDKMLLLYRSSLPDKSKSVNKRKKAQIKAVITMILVSLTFVLCHVLLIVHWVFFKQLLEPGFDDPEGFCNNINPSQWCVTGYTLIITLIYLNSPLNVLIYYWRCSYLKEQMSATISRLIAWCNQLAGRTQLPPT